LITMIACLPLAIVTLLAIGARNRATTAVAVLVALFGATVLAFVMTTPIVHRSVWYSAHNLLPLFTLVGTAILWRHREADRERPLLRQQLVAVLSAAALFTLVQFPFTVPIYFCYVAPLVILTAVALYSYLRPSPRVVPAIVV